MTTKSQEPAIYANGGYVCVRYPEVVRIHFQERVESDGEYQTYSRGVFALPVGVAESIAREALRCIEDAGRNYKQLSTTYTRADDAVRLRDSMLDIREECDKAIKGKTKIDPAWLSKVLKEAMQQPHSPSHSQQPSSAETSRAKS